MCVCVGGFKSIQPVTKEKQHMKCGRMWIWPTTNNQQYKKKVGLGEFKKTNDLVKHFAILKHYWFELQWKKPTIMNKEFKLWKQQKTVGKASQKTP